MITFSQKTKLVLLTIFCISTTPIYANKTIDKIVTITGTVTSLPFLY